MPELTQRSGCVRRFSWKKELQPPEAYAAVLAAAQRHGFARRRYHELFIFHKK